MKKIILGTLITIILLGGGVVVSAQNNQGQNGNGAVLGNQVKEQNMGTLSEIKNKIQERLAGIKMQVRERIFEGIAVKYMRTIEREEAIVTKIVSRMEKIKSLGGNTAEAEGFVVEAKSHLMEARTAYEKLKAKADSADTFEKVTQEMMVEMREAGKTVQNHLREAHKLLQKTVGSLRGVSQLQNTPTQE